jgi:hypothetical protein
MASGPGKPFPAGGETAGGPWGSMPVAPDGRTRLVHRLGFHLEITMFRLILAIAVLAAGASFSLAADPAKPKKSPEERFAKADKNGDKKLSLEEFLGKRSGDAKEKGTKRFEKLDKDGDQSLTLEEFKTVKKKKGQ